jgi:hypothetical protein
MKPRAPPIRKTVKVGKELEIKVFIQYIEVCSRGVESLRLSGCTVGELNER